MCIRDRNDYDKYIEELKASLPANFEAKGNLVVFVDECHRTQSGKLHTAMKTIMPNAVFIGFTGTPLLKRDKKISIEAVSYTHLDVYKRQMELQVKNMVGLRAMGICLRKRTEIMLGLCIFLKL